MREIFKLLLASSALLLPTLSFAENVQCSNIMTARCMCPAPMVMKCGDKKGHIKADAPLQKLDVVVTSEDGVQRTVSLENPPGGIRDYYVVGQNEWVRDNISGLKSGDQISLEDNGYHLDGKTQLYSDPEATKPTGNVADSGPAEEEVCEYVDEQPSVFSFEEGCSQKMCQVKVKCNLPNGVHIGTAICPATVQGGCPSATECAMDEKVQFSEPSNLSSLEVGSSKNSNDGQNR